MQGSLRQVNELMDDVVREQEERRRSELDALQSQINPHFLYNTLDSIVWMIEGERNTDAVFMVTQLASLFRVSLSKGRTVISIRDEFVHARNYMNIQKVRYKDAFEVSWDIQDEILDYCTVKLILQPILENAIYYGVDALGDEGEIVVSGRKEGDDILLSVRDNGLGMPQEKVDQILSDEEHEERTRREDHAPFRPAVRAQDRERARRGDRSDDPDPRGSLYRGKPQGFGARKMVRGGAE